MNKLSCLRSLSDKGVDELSASKFRNFMMGNVDEEWFTQAHEIFTTDLTGGKIHVQSAIQLFEIYRNELIKPPRLVSKQTFDKYTLHEIETADFSWMDDGGKSFLEDICDLPFFTLYDEMPKLHFVADWFIATKPVLDNNQIKRGWAYLEKSSEEWHERDESYDFYDVHISEYPSWNCVVEDHHQEWCSVIPPGNPYKLIPLISPQQLLAETKAMHHCVVTYLGNCIDGGTRIFSVRDYRNIRVATAEITVCSGLWSLVQLKGMHNQEFMNRTYISDDPLTIVLDVLVKWYNKKMPVYKTPTSQFCTDIS
jgi:hypothetical protein